MRSARVAKTLVVMVLAFHADAKEVWSLFVGNGLRLNVLCGDGVVFQEDSIPPQLE